LLRIGDLVVERSGIPGRWQNDNARDHFNGSACVGA
jgi:hypothetical protein